MTLRQKPGANKKQIGKLSVNTQFAVIGSGTDSKVDLWSKIRVESDPLQGRVGYVKPKYLNAGNSFVGGRFMTAAEHAAAEAAERKRLIYTDPQTGL